MNEKNYKLLSDLIGEYKRKVLFLRDNHESLSTEERLSLDRELDSLEDTIMIMEGIK